MFNPELEIIPTFGQNLKVMSNKTRNVLKIIAIVLVVMAVMMQIHWLVVPYLPVYRFWMAITGFALLLISSK
jgi:hypothetical protein